MYNSVIFSFWGHKRPHRHVRVLSSKKMKGSTLPDLRLAILQLKI